MKKHLTNPKKPICIKNSLLALKVLSLLALVLAMNFSVQAASELLLSERIQLQVDNVSLKDALKEIERQSDFTFLYNDASIDVSQVITLSTDELSVSELLDEILDNRGINYTIIDNQIVLTRASERQADKKTVTGTITDSETNSGLPGVTILEKGTGNGTITDLDGKYSISVPGDAVLVISYVGYVTEEISVAGMTELSIALVPDIISLEDVVVIGYGTVRKSDLTGAVAKVDEDMIVKTPAPDLNQALQGKTAGVYITSNSGSPGAGTTVRIRGVGTVTNADPLYVVDGVMLSASEVNFLNPEDIESMQILKDASATAIYGSRGANGVILVTTKNGQAGVSNIQLSYYQGVQNRMQMLDMCDADEYTTLLYRIDHPESPDTMLIAPDTVGNTNWFDEVFRTGKVRNVYFSATNGNEHSTYHFSASYLDQQGIIINSGFKRLNLKLNSKHVFRNWTFGQQVLFNNNNKSVVPENEEYSSVMANAISVDPYSVPFIIDENGELNWGPSLLSNYQNPVATAQIGRIDYDEDGFSGGRYHEIRNRFFGTFYAEYRPVKWLTLKSQFAGKLDYDKYETFRQQYYIESNDYNPNSVLYNRFANTKYWNWENTATIDHTFNEKHHITFLLGTTAENTFYTWVEAQNNGGRGLENEVPELRYFTYYPRDNDMIDGSGLESSLISYLARLNYSLNNKYFITASVRRDGSSKFGTGYENNIFNGGRWGTFPSFALMWKISNESFFPQSDILYSMKIRYGLGQTGNQNIGTYPFAATVASQYARYVFNQDDGSIAQGAFPFQGANDAIHWETTQQSNVGVDMGFFKDKLTFTGDFFIRKTMDMLWQPGIPATVGIPGPPYQNMGDVKNTGFELTLGYRHVQGDFGMNIEGNFTWVKNKVTSVNGAAALDAGNGFGDNDTPFTRIEEGYPIGYFYGYVTDGLFHNYDEINHSAQGWADPGDVRFVDLDGDGVITTADRTMIGNPIPPITYGLNAEFSYKMFDIALFFQGTKGGDIFFPWLRWIYDGTNAGRNYHTDLLDAWTPENSDSDIPKIGASNNDNLKWSDLYVFDGSYLRLKTLEIGFTLPKALAEKLTLSNLRIYMNGTNLLTITKYPWFDPEIGRTGIEEDQEGFKQYIYGVDYGLYPQSRAIIGGVQLTF